MITEGRNEMLTKTELSNSLARKVLKKEALIKYSEYDYLIVPNGDLYDITYRDGMIIVSELNEKHLNRFFINLGED